MRFIPAQYRKLFFAGLVIQIITAWFSVGFHHFDEHFQIMEFASYKLGDTPVSELAWEFSAQCRPALQPFIAFCFGSILKMLHIYNPFLLTLILRLVSACFNWLAISLLTVQLLPEFHSEKVKRLFIGSTFLFFFIPYLGVRFSSENFSATLLLFAIYFILQIKNDGVVKKNYTSTLLAGLFLGFAFFTRLQVAFAIVGLGIWLLFIRKLPLKYLLVMIGASILSISICIVVDYWLYGKWLFSPYNYFDVNIIQNLAAEKFGTASWHFYLRAFMFSYVPVIGIALVAFYAWAVLKKPFHLFTLMTLLFIIAHSAIGHKEMRFLFPISFPFLFVSFLGLDMFLQQYPNFIPKNVFKWTLRVTIVLNCILLGITIFTPARISIPSIKYICDRVPGKCTSLICLEEDIFRPIPLNMVFYKPVTLDIHIINELSGLDSLVNKLDPEKTLLTSKRVLADSIAAKYQLKQVYTSLPKFLFHFNYGDWVSRTTVWTIYEVNTDR